jgi:hypothetical protein
MAAVDFHTYCQPETVSTISWSDSTAEKYKAAGNRPIKFFTAICKKMLVERLQTGKLVLSSFNKL